VYYCHVVIYRNSLPNYSDQVITIRFSPACFPQVNVANSMHWGSIIMDRAVRQLTPAAPASRKRCQAEPKGVAIPLADCDAAFQSDSSESTHDLQVFSNHASKADRHKAVAYVAFYGNGAHADEAADQVMGVGICLLLLWKDQRACVPS
jgi:hypothetical protein